MKVNSIILAGKTYPIKCDLNVLERLQEEFGSINEFERKILGIEYAKDKSGNQKYAKNGDPIISIVEPSITAIKAVLVEMVKEGAELEAARKGTQLEEIDEKELIASCDMSYTLLAQKLHDEYSRCFVTKKE